MNRIFGIDSKFFEVMGRVADLIILNVVCLIFCIPLITIGPALTALSYMTQKMVRDEEQYIIRGFWHSFKENFRQGIAVHLIVSVIGGLLAFDIYYANVIQGREGFYNVFFYVSIVLAAVLFLGTLYLYPVLAKFDNTVKRTFQNAFLMIIAHLPQTIIMALMIIVPVFFMYISDQVAKYGLFVTVLMGLALVSYFKSVFIVKIFDNYLPKEETEEEENDIITESEEN